MEENGCMREREKIIAEERERPLLCEIQKKKREHATIIEVSLNQIFR